MNATYEDFPSAYDKIQFADIDSYLLPRSGNIYGKILKFGDFTDTGTFLSLYLLNDKDSQQNVIIGNAVMDELSTGNIIINNTDKPLVVINTKDSAVVSTAEGNLVAPLHDANNVGAIYKIRIHQH